MIAHLLHTATAHLSSSCDPDKQEDPCYHRKDNNVMPDHVLFANGRGAEQLRLRTTLSIYTFKLIYPKRQRFEGSPYIIGASPVTVQVRACFIMPWEELPNKIRGRATIHVQPKDLRPVVVGYSRSVYQHLPSSMWELLLS